MKYQNKDEQLVYTYLTSWGATTRLIGAVVMVHGDQKGLVLPPRVAPIQAVIIPILKAGKDNSAVLQKVQNVAQELKKTGIRVHVDDEATKTPGAKFYHWELRGVPVRIEIGPRDLEKGGAIVADRLGISKEFVVFDELDDHTKTLLNTLQTELYNRALARRDGMWHKVEKLTDFCQDVEKKGGFYQTGWCGDAACEETLKQYKASIRCILEEGSAKECFACNKPSKQDVLIAKSY